MAAAEHLKILQQGVAAWNKWRQENPKILIPDLTGADLRWAGLNGANLFEAYLQKANLRGATLWRADLTGAYLIEANLSGADLRWAVLSGAILPGADLSEANLSGADLSGATLRRADLSQTNLSGADLSMADLSMADLRRAQLIETDLRGATLTGSYVYGASVWGINVNDQTKQQNLVITPYDSEEVITVDNIEVAQFIYLLLNNQAIRKVIDTITSKAVLILGRFSKDRKNLLDAIREELRKHNYLPIMFDFPPEANRSTIETVTTLARMAKFVVADLTDARSVLQELQAIVPDLPSLAVRLIIKRSQHEHGMLDFIRRFPWVIKDPYEYENVEEAVASIKENVIGPAEAKVKELRPGN